MTRDEQSRLALLIAEERAVWDGREHVLITPGPERHPMLAEDAIVLYGMALRHAIGRVPIAA